MTLSTAFYSIATLVEEKDDGNYMVGSDIFFCRTGCRVFDIFFVGQVVVYLNKNLRGVAKTTTCGPKNDPPLTAILRLQPVMPCPKERDELHASKWSVFLVDPCVFSVHKAH